MDRVAQKVYNLIVVLPETHIQDKHTKIQT